MQSRRAFLGTAAAASAFPIFGAQSLLGQGQEASPANSPADRGNKLCLMTFNLRYGSNTPPNDWPSRRPLVKTLLEKYQPDVVGTQEGLYHQVRHIDTDMPAYDWIGLGRDGGSRGEFMAIYYRKERFEPLEYDHFWLSDTPDVMGSSTWGNTNRRMVTWVRFKDLQSSREFYYWNTHLDHALQPAREKASLLIQERIGKLDTNVPLFLVGDFNAVARQNRIYDILVEEAGLIDTWYAAAERRDEDANTFNGFRPLQRRGQRIDWILARGSMDVHASEVVTLQPGGEWPSDHCPVATWVTLT